ncbi:H-NS family nucleoid-associated regulatory protein [Motiliproteus sediminis]|uniref:H-NS histone family protein n=1 Tax=Motiliproteus sediminis TaxID=1468178 RepID=UPI001AEF7374|nr:H-NS histone family protein [Motiliproteus sediminis]
MSDSIQLLLRKNSFRKAAKDLSVAELEKLLTNAQEVIEERAAEEAAAAEANKEKKQKIEELRKAMAQAGISAEELEAAIGGAKAKSATKGSVKPKYQIEGVDGNIVQWTGRGRTPKVFQEYFDNGGSKEDCLI